ncbi:MAG: hypothetical protein AAGF66_06210 [Cyanobacteria bacterium P01_H01_bin.119]
MAGFGDLVQKAFYLGVGAASYASEKAGTTFGELRSQAEKIAEELVARGEMTADEAQRVVNEMVSRAQAVPQGTDTPEEPRKEPRRIEIIDDDDVSAASAVSGVVPEDAETLRQQVSALRQELDMLKRNQS